MNIPIKRVFNLIITTMAAIVVVIVFKINNPLWLVLSCILTCYCVHGRSFRHGLHAIVLMLLTIAVVSWIFQWKIAVAYHDAILCGVFLFSSFFVFKKTSQNYMADLIFTGVVGLFFALLFSGTIILPECGLDIMLGGIIGLIGGYIIFPLKLYSELTRSLLPILRELIDFSEVQRFYFYEKNKIEKQKYNLQSLFIHSENNYPEWIYEPGFNPALRSGFRYFLTKLEHLIELFYAIDLCLFDERLEWNSSILENEIKTVIEKNQELLSIIYNYFSNNSMSDTASDYMNDIIDLEKKLQQNVPTQLELLDMSPSYIGLTSLVRNLKDTRNILIDMISALPKS
jgi:hypothetical protein